MSALLDQIPGYREAVNRENAIRDASFLGVTEEICSVPVLPMTARHFLILDGIGSPLLHRGHGSEGVTAADVALFLWVVSLRFTSSRFRRWRFIRSIRQLPFVEVCCQVRRYVEDTFQDAPQSDGDAQDAPYFSNVTQLIDAIAREYHWPEGDILTMPLKRLFQYLRRIARRRNPKAAMFNPSDKVRADWLAQLNQKGAHGV